MNAEEFDLRKLSDEEFIEFEKRFNAEKALRGSSWWPKSAGIDGHRLFNYILETFPNTTDEIQTSIHRDLEKTILLLTDFATLNFVDDYKPGDLLLTRPRRKTQLNKTERDEYLKVSSRFLDILIGGGKE